MKIIDIRALQGGGRSGVEVYIEGFLRELLYDKCVGDPVVLWVNAASDVILPEFVFDMLRLDNVRLVHTKLPNKVLNISCSVFRWPKIDQLKELKDVIGEAGEVELWVMDPRPSPVSGYVKKCVVVHDLSPVKFPHFFSLRAKLWFKLVRLRKELREADQIYAVSEFTKSELIGFDSSLRGKTHVKYPVVCQGNEGACVDNVRRRYKIPEGSFLLSLSTLEPRKNIDSLIEKFLNGDFPGYDFLVIAGKKNERIFGKTMYAHDPRIVFTGFVKEADKWALYGASSGFACLSFYEGYGIPVKEAMLYELPLILSDIPVFREVTGNYKNVTWVQI